MKRYIMLLVAVALLGLQTGCASYAANKYTQAQNPIRIHMTEGGGVIGFDLWDWQAVSDRPFLHLGAALADGLMMYGAYELGEKHVWGDSGRSRKNVTNENSNDGINFSVSGDGNVVIVNQPNGSMSNAETTAQGSGSGSTFDRRGE